MQRAVAASKSGKEEEYDEILHLAITVIETSRLHIAKQLNSVTMSSYWEIGKLLYERKVESKHGESIIKRLATDLKSKYPDMGLSPRNLWDMKRFYLRYCKNDKKVRQAVAVLPWSHNLLLMGYDLNPEHILFYANEVFKSTYNLGFIDAVKPLKEIDLERHLVHKITTFIMELGSGFSFIGNQHTLMHKGKEYRVDLLFFHRRLRSMIAIELKIGEFKPEYVGKMNFYLSLLDKLEKAPDENPSIGIILCAEKDHLEVELALQDINKPISIAEYQYLLPKDRLQKLVSDEIHKSK